MSTKSFIVIIFVFGIAVIGMLCILLVVYAALGHKDSEQPTTYSWNHPQGQQPTIGWLKVLSLLVALVAALAGLLQVREVRLFLGLDPPPVLHNENKTAQDRPSDVYAIRLFNCDDECRALINGTNIIEAGFGEDTGWIDVSNNLKSKANTIRFQVINTIGAITYGFQVRKNNQAVFEQVCGTVRVSGCEGNRQDFPTGVARVFTFNVSLP